MRKTTSWRAEQLREFALHLDATIGSIKDVNPDDRRELERVTGVDLTEAKRRATKMCRAARVLEKRLRFEARRDGTHAA